MIRFSCLLIPGKVLQNFCKIQNAIDSEEYSVSDMDNYMEELEHYLDEALKLSKSLKDDLY